MILTGDLRQNPNSTVIASMLREQTCLQGFANDGIHETIGVFLKNAKNRQVFVRR